MARESATITATGIKDVDNALAELTYVMQTRVVQASAYQAAKRVTLPAARRNAPRDTGAMVNSLRVRPIGYRRRRYRRGELLGTGQRGSSQGAKVETRYYGPISRSTMNWEKGGNYSYHTMTEMGGKKNRYKARSWLRDALYKKQRTAMMVFIRTMRRVLGSEVSKISKQKIL